MFRHTFSPFFLALRFRQCLCCYHRGVSSLSYLLDCIIPGFSHSASRSLSHHPSFLIKKLFLREWRKRDALLSFSVFLLLLILLFFISWRWYMLLDNNNKSGFIRTYCLFIRCSSSLLRCRHNDFTFCFICLHVSTRQSRYPAFFFLSSSSLLTKMAGSSANPYSFNHTGLKFLCSTYTLTSCLF